jgi:hypothetical protein
MSYELGFKSFPLIPLNPQGLNFLTPPSTGPVFLRHSISSLAINFIIEKKTYEIGFILILGAIYALHAMQDPNYIAKRNQAPVNAFNNFFEIKDVPGDHNCFFHSIANQLDPSLKLDHKKLRKKSVELIGNYFKPFFKNGLLVSDRGLLESVKKQMIEQEYIKEGDLITLGVYQTFSTHFEQALKDNTTWARDLVAIITAADPQLKQVVNNNNNNYASQMTQALDEDFFHYFKNGIYDETGSSKITNLFIALRENRLITHEATNIPAATFEEFLEQIGKEGGGFLTWGSDLFAPFLAEAYDLKIHIVHQVRQEPVSLVELLFGHFPIAQVTDYKRQVHGNGKTNVYIYHSGNHFQMIHIKDGYAIEMIAEDNS